MPAQFFTGPWPLAVTALAIAVGVGGCARRAPPPLPPPITMPIPEIDPWPGVLAQAKRLAEDGHYGPADRLLADYAVKHQGTAQGAEADFWRALFRVDPLNTESSTREQLAALDAYLHGGPSQPRYLEALILRRLVEAADSARAVVAEVHAAVEARTARRDDEVRRISDELEKAVAELERIRRRLAPRPNDRKPPPPPNR